MRRPNRHVEIFSISALDLFASALGAFILVAIILFPYYLKDQEAATKLVATQGELAAAQADVTSARTEAAAAKAALEQARAAADREAARSASLRAELDSSRERAGKTFVVVVIRWTTPAADVDLHVIDPAGNDFYWFRTNVGRRDYPQSPAELSFDMTSGPGVELWQDPAAVPGRYTVDYVANALPEGYTVEVSGTVFDQAGQHDLPSKVLRRAKERVHGASLDVESDGHVTIR